ncbi:MAG: hypothetical protein JSS68_03695, partial [Actinobacteria bacterium]|nr:hypothetical protein [Actinomycetota bacterium]
SEGEFQAAQKLTDAADIISTNPASLQLRYLQTLLEIGSNQNTTVVFPLPMDVLEPFVHGMNPSKPRPKAPAPPGGGEPVPGVPDSGLPGGGDVAAGAAADPPLPPEPAVGPEPTVAPEDDSPADSDLPPSRS